MPKQLKWLLTLILLLSLAGLACQTLTSGEDETPADSTGDVEQPAANDALVEGGEEVAGQAETDTETQAAPFLDLGQLSGQTESTEVNSYRMALIMRIEPEAGGEPLATIEMQGTFQNEPAASTMAMSVAGVDELTAGAGNIVITQIEGTTYSQFGDTCFASEGGADAMGFTNMADFENFLSGVGQAELVESNVTVNGIQTNHYTFEQQDVSALDGLTEIHGDVFVATDGGYPVRILFTGTGDVTTFGLTGEQSGTIVYEMNFSDFNQPVNIESPADCGAAAESEFPLLDDAFEMTSFSGFLSYKTDKLFAEVVDFYKAEMAAAGWNLTSEFASEPVAQLVFSLDGREVTVSVVEDSTSHALLVNIIE